MLALATLVSRQGYRSVRTADLASAAAVSKADLYRHFGGKRGCFLAIAEEAADGTARAVEQAAGRGRGPGERLRAAIGTLIALVSADPDTGHLVLVDSLALGAAGLPLRRHTARRFEAIVAGIFAVEGVPIAPAATTAIVAGIGGVLRRRLRRRRREEPGALAGELADWAMDVAGEQEWEPGAVLAAPGRRHADKAGEVPWDEAPRSPRARRTLDRRERFIRAAAWVTAEQGYDALSIPVISYAAASSNEAFYRHFLHRCEPLLEAFDLLAARMTAACRHTRPPTPTPTPTLAGAAAAGVAALRGEGAAGTVFARLAFVGLPSVDEAAMRRAEKALDALADTLLRSVPAPHPLVAEADRCALAGLIEAALLPDRGAQA